MTTKILCAIRWQDHGYNWSMTLNNSQLDGNNYSNWDGNGLGYGAVEVTEQVPGGTLPVGAYIFVNDRIVRTTDSGLSFSSYAKATAKPGTSLARGAGFFEQSDSYLRKDGTLLHGTRFNTNGSW